MSVDNSVALIDHWIDLVVPDQEGTVAMLQEVKATILRLDAEVTDWKHGALGWRTESERLGGNVLAALSEMDHSTYGDPEVPFRMRAALTGAGPEPHEARTEDADA